MWAHLFNLLNESNVNYAQLATIKRRNPQSKPHPLGRPRYRPLALVDRVALLAHTKPPLVESIAFISSPRSDPCGRSQQPHTLATCRLKNQVSLVGVQPASCANISKFVNRFVLAEYCQVRVQIVGELHLIGA